MKILIIISCLFISSCAWVQKPAITKAIILCNGNGGLVKIRLTRGGSYVEIFCANGALFEIENEKVYTKLEGL